MGQFALPPKAIEMYRTARHDPEADRGAEFMTTSFIWSDETAGVPGNLPSVRALFGYRGSLQRGKPDDTLREPWDQLMDACPEWPGYRPERCSSTLREEIEREWGELAAAFIAMAEERGTDQTEKSD